MAQLDSRGDLRNVCLVSKDFHTLAVPRLYGSLVIGPREQIRSQRNFFRGERDGMKSRRRHWREFLELVGRLSQNPDRQDAHAVREVDIARFHRNEQQIAAEFEREDALAALVKALPNLAHFRYVTLRSLAPALY